MRMYLVFAYKATLAPDVVGTWLFEVCCVPSFRVILALTQYGGLVGITTLVENPDVAFYRASLKAVLQAYRLTICLCAWRPVSFI